MRIVAVAAIVGMFSFASVCFAEMSSSNFQIRWDNVGAGGSDTSSSASFQLRDTVGQAAPGNSTGTTLQLAAGYRGGVNDQVITFEVLAQDASSERGVSALVGTTITTSTDDLSVGDFVVLVQDEGAGQVSAVGKITSIGGSDITLDELRDGGVAPVIDGTNDVLFQLSTTSADLGTLTASTLNTAVIGMNVMAEVDNGYTVQVFDDGDLRNGINTIDDVLDGAVTTGSEEYGGRSSDTSLTGSTFDTQDTAFTTSFQRVADRPDTSFEDRDFVTLKASINGGTTAAAYAHVISFIVSGNY